MYSVTVPVMVTGCFVSYCAPPWCANIGPETMRRTTPAANTANGLLFIFPPPNIQPIGPCPHNQQTTCLPKRPLYSKKTAEARSFIGLHGVVRPHLQKFLAEDPFQELKPRRKQILNYLSCPGLFVSFRIVDRELVLQGILVQAPDALHKVESIAVRMTVPVDPIFVIESDSVNDERVSLILANRVPHPRVRISVGMSSPIHVDSAHQVILIEQEEHHVRELTELV